MTDNDVLNAEYRAFVRQLHEQTIAIVAEADRYWNRELFREVAMFTAGVFDREYDEAQQKEVWDRAMELQDRLQNDIQPKLNILAFGHPDPDVRRAADIFSRRLQGVVFYHDVIHARRREGEHATTAIQLAHRGLTELRRAAYHAPFQVERPQPEYDGNSVHEPMASQLTDVPPEEW
ncbi:hypothetical protein [Mycobacterium sp. DL440]|uniref:hypothetical protein n=1 Tax=Mycobacterium sp. DL440 TaxID=2675523 RepID=UPI001423254C|nr:hypothetical protein [Mycobacterium sp. DL440]